MVKESITPYERLEKLPRLLSSEPEVEILGITRAPKNEALERGLDDLIKELEGVVKSGDKVRFKEIIDAFRQLRAQIDALDTVGSSPLVFAGESARTCYSAAGIMKPADYQKPRNRAITDRVIESTRNSGHLTPRQHWHVTFGLSRISRQLAWSFLHGHPFYNSEQVSQRYVGMSEAERLRPPLPERALALYDQISQRQEMAYDRLVEFLTPIANKEYFRIFPKRSLPDKRPGYEKIVERKAREVARYLLGVSTHTYMYHTISALTLARYHKACQFYDVPLEAQIMVNKMVAEVAKIEPRILEEVEDQVPLEETPEFCALASLRGRIDFETARSFKEEFDEQLGEHTSKLVDWMVNAEVALAGEVRAVLGLPKSSLSDEEAIEFVLNPEKNRLLGYVFNLMTMSKLSRSLYTIAYHFAKKISHTADSQNQRHRMTPGPAPILAAQYSGEADYVTPELIRQSTEALNFYQNEMEVYFQAINQLLEMGVSPEYAFYLLPNGTALRFGEIGDLLNLYHKYKMRLCYNAQEEIWNASVDEVSQIREVHPQIGKFLLPPCDVRKLARMSPFCPEGDRYCGVPVWTLDLKYYKRLI